MSLICFRVLDSTKGVWLYSTFKDVVPLIIATPAVWLGYTLQRRNSYSRQLRNVWTSVIVAVQETNEYLDSKNSNTEKLSEIMVLLSSSIDEVRGVFANLDGELYPFEPIKQIYQLLRTCVRSTH